MACHMVHLILASVLASKAAGIASVVPPFFPGLEPSASQPNALIQPPPPSPPPTMGIQPQHATLLNVRPEALPCSKEELHNKTYDVLLIGGTGALGHAVFESLLERKHMSEHPKWAVIVRNANLFRYKFAEKYGEGRVNDITVVGLDIRLNQEMLEPLVRQAKVVLNLVSPYEEAGSETVVQASILACAHYVDASTTTKWKRYVKDKYGVEAKLRELSIVQGAGIESTVSDLAAMAAASDLVKSGLPAPTKVTLVWDMANGLANSAKIKSEQAAIMRYGWVMDPYILAPETPQELRVDTVVDGWGEKRQWDPILKVALQPFGPGRSDAVVVRRSMNMQYPDKAISVQEACTFRMQEDLRQFRLRANASTPAAPNEVRATEVLEQGSFMVRAVALFQAPNSGKDESVPYTTVTVEGLGDPQYIAAPKIALQVALGLAFDDSDRKSGYVTPSMALGPARLEQRLSQVDDGKFIRFLRD